MHAIDAFRINRIADAGPFERPEAERYQAAQIIVRNAEEECRALGVPLGITITVGVEDEAMRRRVQEIMDRTRTAVNAQGFELNARYASISITLLPRGGCIVS